MITQIPSNVLAQIPEWFWVCLAIGCLGIISAGASTFIKYVINKNKTEMSDMKMAITEMSKSMIDIASLVKVHEYRINDNANDIRELQSHVNGNLIVNYKKND